MVDGVRFLGRYRKMEPKQVKRLIFTVKYLPIIFGSTGKKHPSGIRISQMSRKK